MAVMLIFKTICKSIIFKLNSRKLKFLQLIKVRNHYFNSNKSNYPLLIHLYTFGKHKYPLGGEGWKINLSSIDLSMYTRSYCEKKSTADV